MPWSPTNRWWVWCKQQWWVPANPGVFQRSLWESCVLGKEEVCGKWLDVVLKKDMVEPKDEVRNAHRLCAAFWLWKDTVDFVWPMLKLYWLYPACRVFPHCGIALILHMKSSWEVIIVEDTSFRARTSKCGSSVLKWEEAYGKRLFHQFEVNSSQACFRDKWLLNMPLLWIWKELELDLQILSHIKAGLSVKPLSDPCAEYNCFSCNACLMLHLNISFEKDWRISLFHCGLCCSSKPWSSAKKGTSKAKSKWTCAVSSGKRWFICCDWSHVILSIRIFLQSAQQMHVLGLSQVYSFLFNYRLISIWKKFLTIWSVT